MTTDEDFERACLVVDGEEVRGTKATAMRWSF
jgi:hypothetical protein